jgi:hypothetical protein
MDQFGEKMGRAFGPCFFIRPITWGGAPGWYGLRLWRLLGESFVLAEQANLTHYPNSLFLCFSCFEC